MLIISGYLIRRQNEIYRNELEKRGRALVANLAYNAEFGVILESESDLTDLLRGIAQADDVIYASIRSSDGRVLAESGEKPIVSESDQTISEKDENFDREVHIKHYAVGDGAEFIELHHPVLTKRQEISRENLGTVMNQQLPYLNIDMEMIGDVCICLSLTSLNLEVSRSQSAAILLTFMVVFSAIIIMMAFVRIITQPVKSLVEVTDQISKGDLSLSVEINRKDEIGLLAESFNRMIESLKKSQLEIEDYNRTLEEKIIERTRELENAQVQLIQSEKLAGVGQLAAGVAHELNNPLGGILGYSQFTLEKMEKKDLESLTQKDYESFKRYLSDIETQTRRCKAIVQNLLKFSRSPGKTEFQDIDLNQALTETLTFVEHQLVINQISLKKNLDQNMPLIKGNANQ
jgi:signal transduction histidine kinase